MVPVHLTENRLVIKVLSRSCLPRTKGQAKPWQDEVSSSSEEAWGMGMSIPSQMNHAQERFIYF